MTLPGELGNVFKVKEPTSDCIPCSSRGHNHEVDDGTRDSIDSYSSTEYCTDEQAGIVGTVCTTVQNIDTALMQLQENVLDWKKLHIIFSSCPRYMSFHAT
jgi:hypothetical protein